MIIIVITIINSSTKNLMQGFRVQGQSSHSSPNLPCSNCSNAPQSLEDGHQSILIGIFVAQDTRIPM